MAAEEADSESELRSAGTPTGHAGSVAHARRQRISWSSDELTHAQAKNLKASLVIDKPFDVDQVVEVVRRILPPR